MEAMKICSSCARILPESARECPADGASTRHITELPAGAKLGAYRVVRLLGEGGMGSVYEAHHEELGRRAAIKLLRDELVENQAVVVRFLQEARAVNLIRHDHIIDVYDYGDGSSGAVYFVMEYLEGETLGDLLRRRGRIEPPLLAHLFGQILEALGAAHDKQVVHRDLKPANVYIIRREDDPFFVKLLDFGVAKLTGEGAIPGLTRAGALIGTPQYMSPEQLEGQPIDARSDLFAIGVMMYRAVVGQAPFRGESFGELAHGILNEPHMPPRQAAPEAHIPSTLEALIDRALAKDPAARFESAEEMRRALEAFVGALSPDDLLDARGESVPRDDVPMSAVTGTPGARLAQSLPEYQGAEAAAAKGEKGPRSLRRVFLAAGAVAIASAVALAFGIAQSLGSDPEEAELAGEQEPALTSETDDEDLATLLEGDASQQRMLLEALKRAGTAYAAPLLYELLEGPPQARVQSAEILAALELPEAAPRIRDALARSGDRLRVELAISLLSVGDGDAAAILEEAARQDDAAALSASVALAEAGRGEEVGERLREVFEATPAGRGRWLLAARGLVALGDEEAREALRGELAHRDAARSIAAAAVLLGADDADAQAFLGRIVGDPSHTARAEAALALAKRGKPEALAFVTDGLASEEASARAIAIAVAAHLAREGGVEHGKTIAALAQSDPNSEVRITAKVARLALE
jgi:serine/threonine protein kinase/HEAT repeat protein